MRQVVHKLGSGQLILEDFPLPACGPGTVLIRNHYSLISAGTEAATLRTARSSLVGKARQRPREVRMLLDLCRRQGPGPAYRAVMKRLDAYSPLGYSSAGEVVSVGGGVSEFEVGDLAAAAGAGYANHAEFISVPANLCVKLPPHARLDLAAYNTLGAIALQGMRQADPKLGESCVVIGLGLVGQLTGILLRAAGVRTIGIDLDPFAVSLALKGACDAAWLRGDEALPDRIDAFTHGLGADAVIITAASSSLDPINFAGRVARKRGRVVVVGAIPTGFDRDPFWYRKELELRMSCSYGPGRYDRAYEESGLDYPAAYVRWTEKRNMAAFQELIHGGRIDLSYLTTHEFSVEDAPRAYQLLIGRAEPFLGVLLRYDPSRPVVAAPIRISPEERPAAPVRLALIGAGSHAQGYLLPNLPGGPEFARVAVLDNEGTASRRVAEKHHFQLCAARQEEIFDQPGINTVLIATRHDSHAAYVIRGLETGKHVFVEKPLALTCEQLTRIADAYTHCPAPLLMVGYNRRFSPLAAALKEELGDGPMSMIYRVNAGAIPPESWIHDPAAGGGRILGEVCHFIDFLSFACGAPPCSIFASALPDPRGHHDTLNIQATFENGSIGTIAYYANGSPELPKEYVEIYSAGRTAIIHDFHRLDVYRPASHTRRRLWFQDKGHKHLLAAFLDAIKDGLPAPIRFEDLRRTSAATFAIQESLVRGQPVPLA